VGVHQGNIHVIDRTQRFPAEPNVSQQNLIQSMTLPPTACFHLIVQRFPILTHSFESGVLQQGNMETIQGGGH